MKMVKPKIKAKIFELAGGYAVRVPKALVDTGLLKNKEEYTFEVHIPDEKDKNAGSRMFTRDNWGKHFVSA